MREKLILSGVVAAFALTFFRFDNKPDLAIKVAELEQKDSIWQHQDSLRVRWRQAEQSKTQNAINALKIENKALKIQVTSVNEKLKKTDKIIWTVVEKQGTVEMTNQKGNFSFTMTKERQVALNHIWKLCYDVEKTLRGRKVLASIALVESNALKGRGYKEGNNWCNIKHYDGKIKAKVCPFPKLCKGSISIHDDHEGDRFCKYATPKIGLIACSKLIHNGRYVFIWDKYVNTSKELLQAIDVLGFATTGNHAEMTTAVDHYLKDYK